MTGPSNLGVSMFEPRICYVSLLQKAECLMVWQVFYEAGSTATNAWHEHWTRRSLKCCLEVRKRLKCSVEIGKAKRAVFDGQEALALGRALGFKPIRVERVGGRNFSTPGLAIRVPALADRDKAHSAFLVANGLQWLEAGALRGLPGCRPFPPPLSWTE